MGHSKEQLKEMLEKSQIRFNDPYWVKKTVQEHFDIKRESFKEYFDNINDYNECINQLKADLELFHGTTLEL